MNTLARREDDVFGEEGGVGSSVMFQDLAGGSKGKGKGKAKATSPERQMSQVHEEHPSPQTYTEKPYDAQQHYPRDFCIFVAK